MNAFTVLRRTIRQAATEYRYANDNSPSLFHPAKGQVYAYPIQKVEEALGAYEVGVRQEGRGLYEMALTVSLTCPSAEAREFAGQVLAYLESAKEEPAKRLFNPDPEEVARQCRA